jgi:hypothetical protein
VERLDQPEGAEVERGLGQAEIVLGGVAQHVLAAPQALLDRVEGGEEARIVGLEEAHVDQLEQAGVELVAAEGRGEALLGREPGGLLDPSRGSRRRARATRRRSSSRPSTSAALASRSQAAQLITEL